MRLIHWFCLGVFWHVYLCCLFSSPKSWVPDISTCVICFPLQSNGSCGFLWRFSLSLIIVIITTGRISAGLVCLSFSHRKTVIVSSCLICFVTSELVVALSSFQLQKDERSESEGGVDLSSSEEEDMDSPVTKQAVINGSIGDKPRSRQTQAAKWNPWPLLQLTATCAFQSASLFWLRLWKWFCFLYHLKVFLFLLLSVSAYVIMSVWSQLRIKYCSLFSGIINVIDSNGTFPISMFWWPWPHFKDTAMCKLESCIFEVFILSYRLQTFCCVMFGTVHD